MHSPFEIRQWYSCNRRNERDNEVYALEGPCKQSASLESDTEWILYNGWWGSRNQNSAGLGKAIIATKEWWGGIEGRKGLFWWESHKWVVSQLKRRKGSKISKRRIK